MSTVNHSPFLRTNTLSVQKGSSHLGAKTKDQHFRTCWKTLIKWANFTRHSLFQRLQQHLIHQPQEKYRTASFGDQTCSLTYNDIIAAVQTSHHRGAAVSYVRLMWKPRISKPWILTKYAYCTQYTFFNIVTHCHYLGCAFIPGGLFSEERSCQTVGWHHTAFRLFRTGFDGASISPSIFCRIFLSTWSRLCEQTNIRPRKLPQWYSCVVLYSTGVLPRHPTEWNGSQDNVLTFSVQSVSQSA